MKLFYIAKFQLFTKIAFQRSFYAPEHFCPKTISAMIITGKNFACIHVFLNGLNLDHRQWFQPKVRLVEVPPTAISPRSVKAIVVDQRTAHIERKDVVQEQCGIPPDSPRIILAGNLAA